MIKIKKYNLISVFVFVFILSGCAVDNQDQTINPTTNKENSNSNEQNLPTTLSFYTIDGEEDLWNDPVAKVIKEATGVTLKTEYPVNGTDQLVALMIATSNYTDLIYAKGEGEQLIEAGALIDMRDLIEQYGPNIKKLYGEDFESLRYSEEDSSIYQFTTNAANDVIYRTSGTAQLQYDVLAENNYDIPYTIDQYEKMIKDYMKKNPQIDGLDTIGLSLSCSDWRWMITLSNPSGFIANGSPDNGQWIIEDDNNYRATYKHAAKGQKEYFQWLNRMYHEGVLDSDFATQTHEDYLAKIANGRVLGILDANWDYNEAIKILEADGKYNRTYAGLPVTMNESIKCSSLMDRGLAIGWGVGITTSCKDPVRAIQFLDYLCSDEGQVLTHWGIENVNYFIDANGIRYRTKDEIVREREDKDYSKKTGVGYHSYPFPTYGSLVTDLKGNTYTTNNKQNVIEAYNEAEKAALVAWDVSVLTDIFPQAEEFERPLYGPVWSQYADAEFKNTTKILDDIAWSGIIASIICPEEEFDTKWQVLQENLKKAGAEQVGKMLTEHIQKQVAFKLSSK